ncbi:MAG: amidohydrolase family protein [Acidobacteriota bacterium]|nr:amidohydrolase family protein [Acidobacteriota bacterium]
MRIPRAVLCALLIVASNIHGASLAITHVTVINPADANPRRDVTVVIRDGRIAEIGNTTPSDAEVVDGRGKFLIPGLWDMHVHLSYTTSSALPLLIANGVTTVRDMGSKLAEIDDWRARIGAGALVGPRILRVGPILNGKSFNQYQMVAGNPDETRGVARALKEVGVDFLKIHRRLPRDSYFALIHEAKKLGIDVVGHIPMNVSPEEASDSGQVTLEHTETLFKGTFAAALKEPLPDAIRKFREADADKLFARFVKNHTVVDPTLIAWAPVTDPAAKDDPRLRYVAASAKKVAPPPMSAEELQGMRATVAEFRQVVRQLHKDGVTLVTGTDIAATRIPGFTLHGELANLVECGLTPLEALRAATLTPATVTHRANDLGTIEQGKIADAVLLDANPLDDIHNTEKIRAVIVGGRLFRRAELDALLRQAEELAARN